MTINTRDFIDIPCEDGPLVRGYLVPHRSETPASGGVFVHGVQNQLLNLAVGECSFCGSSSGQTKQFATPLYGRRAKDNQVPWTLENIGIHLVSMPYSGLIRWAIWPLLVIFSEW